jgi:hypothetical protein
MGNYNRIFFNFEWFKGISMNAPFCECLIWSISIVILMIGFAIAFSIILKALSNSGLIGNIENGNRNWKPKNRKRQKRN